MNQAREGDAEAEPDRRGLEKRKGAILRVRRAGAAGEGFQYHRAVFAFCGLGSLLGMKGFLGEVVEGACFECRGLTVRVDETQAWLLHDSTDAGDRGGRTLCG